MLPLQPHLIWMPLEIGINCTHATASSQHSRTLDDSIPEVRTRNQSPLGTVLRYPRQSQITAASLPHPSVYAEASYGTAAGCSISVHSFMRRPGHGFSGGGQPEGFTIENETGKNTDDKQNLGPSFGPINLSRCIFFGRT